ncbi:hypothetical protein ACF0H5_012761 [Mactra antiquata]
MIYKRLLIVLLFLDGIFCQSHNGMHRPRRGFMIPSLTDILSEKQGTLNTQPQPEPEPTNPLPSMNDQANTGGKSRPDLGSLVGVADIFGNPISNSAFGQSSNAFSEPAALTSGSNSGSMGTFLGSVKIGEQNMPVEISPGSQTVDIHGNHPLPLQPHPEPFLPVQPHPEPHIPVQPHPEPHLPVQPQPEPHLPVQPHAEPLHSNSNAHEPSRGIHLGEVHIDLPGEHGNPIDGEPVVHRVGSPVHGTHVNHGAPGNEGAHIQSVPDTHIPHLPIQPEPEPHLSVQPHAEPLHSNSNAHEPSRGIHLGEVHIDLPGEHGNPIDGEPVVHRVGSPVLGTPVNHGALGHGGTHIQSVPDTHIPHLPIQPKPEPQIPVQPHPEPHRPLQPLHESHLPVQPPPETHLPVQPHPEPHIPVQPHPEPHHSNSRVGPPEGKPVNHGTSGHGGTTQLVVTPGGTHIQIVQPHPEPHHSNIRVGPPEGKPVNQGTSGHGGTAQLVMTSGGTHIQLVPNTHIPKSKPDQHVVKPKPVIKPLPVSIPEPAVSHQEPKPSHNVETSPVDQHQASVTQPEPTPHNERLPVPRDPWRDRHIDPFIHSDHRFGPGPDPWERRRWEERRRWDRWGNRNRWGDRGQWMDRGHMDPWRDGRRQWGGDIPRDHFRQSDRSHDVITTTPPAPEPADHGNNIDHHNPRNHGNQRDQVNNALTNTINNLLGALGGGGGGVVIGGGGNRGGGFRGGGGGGTGGLINNLVQQAVGSLTGGRGGTFRTFGGPISGGVMMMPAQQFRIGGIFG